MIVIEKKRHESLYEQAVVATRATDPEHRRVNIVLKSGTILRQQFVSIVADKLVFLYATASIDPSEIEKITRVY